MATRNCYNGLVQLKYIVIVPPQISLQSYDAYFDHNFLVLSKTLFLKKLLSLQEAIHFDKVCSSLVFLLTSMTLVKTSILHKFYTIMFEKRKQNQIKYFIER